MTTRFLLSTLRVGLLTSLLCSSLVKADALGLFFGVSGWTADTSGNVQSGPNPIDTEDELGFDSETLTQGYLAFEHFIPLIPNFRLQYTDLGFAGSDTLNKRFDGVDFNGTVNTDFKTLARWILI